MSGMRLKLWGVRGSTPTPQIENMGYGGNTPCLEVRTSDGQIFIFDAGTGVRKLGESLLEEARGEPLNINIFLTHFHWDHIQGIPFFNPLYDARNRIRFLAHHRTGPLRATLKGQMTKPYFPVNFEVSTRDCDFEEVADAGWHGAITVLPFALHHPQGATGYRIECGDASVVYATDHEHGNAELDKGLCDMSTNADLLIYDSQYTPEEYEKHQGWGHSTWEKALHFARTAGVKRVLLFHHDPSHRDEDLDAIGQQAQTSFADAVMARERWTIEL